ncbi:hypothetical protein [Levilactobacillus sp. HBUAS67488]
MPTKILTQTGNMTVNLFGSLTRVHIRTFLNEKRQLTPQFL